MVGAFFPPGGLKNGRAGPDFTNTKSTRTFFEIVLVMNRGLLIYMCGLRGFPVAPLLCGLAVVRVAFWCSGAVEPLPGTSWPPVRRRGPPRLANFDLPASFSGNLKEFFPSCSSCLRARLLGGGLVFTVLVPGCGLFVGARRGGLPLVGGSLVSTTLVGKIVSSRVGGAFLQCLGRFSATLV